MFISNKDIPSIDVKKGMLFNVLSSNKENVVLQPLFEQGAISLEKKDFENNFELHSFE